MQNVWQTVRSWNYRHVFLQRIEYLIAMQFLVDLSHHVQISPILLVLVVVRTLVGFLVRFLADVQQKGSIGYVVERFVFLKRE